MAELPSLTNGSYREFPSRLRDASEAERVRGTKWGGHYISSHLRDAANEIERLRSIIRVNGIRNGAGHDEIDHVLFGSYLPMRVPALTADAPPLPTPSTTNRRAI